VYLTRRDKARQAISLYRAILLDSWWAFEGDEPTEDEKAARASRPDFDEIADLEADLLRDDIRWMDFFAASRVRPYVLSFETLTSAYLRAVRSVVRHVHPTAKARLFVPPPRLRRQADAVSEAWLEAYSVDLGRTARLRAMRAEYRDRAGTFGAAVRRR
jgi:trehalose 2-sulfotransferase